MSEKRLLLLEIDESVLDERLAAGGSRAALSLGADLISAAIGSDRVWLNLQPSIAILDPTTLLEPARRIAEETRERAFDNAHNLLPGNFTTTEQLKETMWMLLNGQRHAAAEIEKKIKELMKEMKK